METDSGRERKTQRQTERKRERVRLDTVCPLDGQVDYTKKGWRGDCGKYRGYDAVIDCVGLDDYWEVFGRQVFEREGEREGEGERERERERFRPPGVLEAAVYICFIYPHISALYIAYICFINPCIFALYIRVYLLYIPVSICFIPHVHLSPRLLGGLGHEVPARPVGKRERREMLDRVCALIDSAP